MNRFLAAALITAQIDYRTDTYKSAKLVWDDTPKYDRVSPAFTCDRDAGQALFDALWAHGYRPNDPVNPDAMSKAKDTHIDDLRTICGKLLDKV